MLEVQEPFKDRFNKAIEIRGLRPVDISKRTGISESAISQYRSGYAEPKADKLSLISEALNVNPVWLMGLDVEMDPLTTGCNSVKSVMDAMNNMDVATIQRLINYAQLLVQVRSE